MTRLNVMKFMKGLPQPENDQEFLESLAAPLFTVLMVVFVLIALV